MLMTLIDAKKQATEEVSKADVLLKTYANKYRLPNGLVPDEYKTEEYKVLISNYNKSFQKQRQINSLYIKI